MSNINTPTASSFFGKDGMVPFIGVVEDVNDPKTSGRVKVRCVGWHPKQKEAGDEGGEDGVTTEDLPWARVGMPVTHVQQSRIGGKHGLLPGCWVIGFFLDGAEAQDPFILSTFSFTSKASEEDYRALPEGQDGTFSSSDKPFDKNVASPKTVPNIDVRTVTEREQKGTSDTTDPSGDNTLDDSDHPCEGKDAGKSVASVRRQNDEMKVGEAGNAEGQRYGTSMADGLCGTDAHARDDMQRKIQERMPSKFARVVYGDAVWNRFTGSHMNMNGIMLQLAYELAQSLKAPANSMKAFTERTINRVTKSATLKAIPDRDGKNTKKADEDNTKLGDEFHAMFAESVIDTLTQTMFDLLKIVNDAGQAGAPGGITGGQTTTNTQITNFEALCIADSLLNNFGSIVNGVISDILDALFGGGGFEFVEDLNNIVSQLGSLSSIMQFPLMQKYGAIPAAFNTAGSRSQDKRTKTDGCNTERVYDVEKGAIKSSAGQSGGGGTGGSSGGLNNWTGIQFGGSNQAPSGSIITLPCSGSLEILIPWDKNGGLGGGFNPEDFDPNDWEFGYGHNTPIIVPRDYDNPTFPIDWDQIRFKPVGYGAELIPRSLPSSEPAQANNFVAGIPNVILVYNPGVNYYFGNVLEPDAAFPSVYIPGYNGTPIPVIDRQTGEFVAVLSNANSWDADTPDPAATAIPDDNTVGIMSDDPEYNIQLGAMFIQNTGFAYENPQFVVIDKDTGRENGKVVPVVQEGRLVELEVVDPGNGFRRIPEVRLLNANQDPGYGADIVPVMAVNVRTDSPTTPTVDLVYCPAKNQINIVTS